MPNLDELFKRRHCEWEIIFLCVVRVGIAGSNSAFAISWK
jgi:hypothetical protein